MKKVVKTIACIVGVFLFVALVFFLCLKYKISWKITDIGTEQSPDGRYSVVFQAVGEADWPFGASHAKVTFKDGDSVVASFRQDIHDDGGQFYPGNYSVEWMESEVIITFKGSEQPDVAVEVFYDGRVTIPSR